MPVAHFDMGDVVNAGEYKKDNGNKNGFIGIEQVGPT